MRLIRIIFFIVILMPGNVNANSKINLEQTKNNLNKIKNEQNEQLKINNNLGNQINKLNILTKSIAKQNREYEKQLYLLEKNINSLNSEYENKFSQLQNNTKKLSSIIISLERISKNPENSIIVYPGSSKTAIQSTIALKTILKQIEKTRIEIKDDLNKLDDLQNTLSVKKDVFLQKQQNLSSNRKKLNEQINNKKLLQKNTKSKINNLQKKSNELLKKIKNIKQFLDKIEAENKKQKLERLNKPESIKNFPRKGKIEIPVIGKLIKSFGNLSISGKKNTGITILSRNKATVITPFDGYVSFSGKFKQLGNVIIISHEGGYNSVMIGFDKIYVDKGSWVLTGEPIGQMPKANPELHFEIRYGTKPLNPLRWLNTKMLRR